MKKALITGVTGQDGSYLAEFLLEKGYEVHGIVRRSSSLNRERLNNIHKSLETDNPHFYLHYGDMTDFSSLFRILSEVKPDEIYNLAAQSHVKISFDIPEYTSITNGLGVLIILEAVRKLGLIDTKIYQASTSELYGKVIETPQNENTMFNPMSPYGVSKLYAYWITKLYRETYGMFICNGILFNHESPRRGENFVSKKITKGVANIKLGLADKISLGNLNAVRDWGFALDYVEVMWLMLQKEFPDNYVIATGECHTIREFAEEAFKVVGINIIWKGEGLEEKGLDEKTGKILVEVNKKFFRPSEVDLLMGDSSKAKKVLGWEPKKNFNELVKYMVDYDLEELSIKKLS
jgi:GDPmannose 4,6-dehydratase